MNDQQKPITVISKPLPTDLAWPVAQYALAHGWDVVITVNAKTDQNIVKATKGENR